MSMCVILPRPCLQHYLSPVHQDTCTNDARESNCSLTWRAIFIFLRVRLSRAYADMACVGLVARCEIRATGSTRHSTVLLCFALCVAALHSPFFLSSLYDLRKAIKHARNVNLRASRLIRFLRVLGLIIFATLTGVFSSLKNQIPLPLTETASATETRDDQVCPDISCVLFRVLAPLSHRLSLSLSRGWCAQP
jgi:hypothetical protein